MKRKTIYLTLILFIQTLSSIGFGQKTESADAVARVAFTLRNNLGYHRMFRAEGPGMAYGFTMNRNESTPKNWPVGSKLYFSKDGETAEEFILTVTAADAGKTLLTDPETTTRSSIPLVTVRFRNNSLLPHKIMLITYRPDETGNGTQGIMLMPQGSTTQKLPVGTKVYFADAKQVNVVMSGQRIDGSKPFLVVKKEDGGKTIDIFR
ncbi:hypothetical protein [Spirosoma radiotolerans]|uniref:Uncharacterized protein n=1 Tax=Spirosoma radiotolerans TaxID=1379870 RepID=A0A0E3ZX60_9BACT|nr:hypothetical protein [Spirosoma radiotolerans]AKD56184.1 hypothetical protein SD10_16040 [Spirosoma radiotolerans]